MMSLMAAEIRSYAVKGGVAESAIHYINQHILELPNQITVVLGHEIQTSDQSCSTYWVSLKVLSINDVTSFY